VILDAFQRRERTGWWGKRSTPHRVECFSHWGSSQTPHPTVSSVLGENRGQLSYLTPLRQVFDVDDWRNPCPTPPCRVLFLVAISED